MYQLLLIAASILAAFSPVEASVVTCGGFVEASSNLAQAISQRVDYSAVKMHLVTADGLLKYTTECAPNGYYFIPIYDKGSFKLKIEGPPGWTFEPKEFPVTVSDREQSCSDDINFKFTGFSISGHVTGEKTSDCEDARGGVAGVTLTLFQDGNTQLSQTTSALPEGFFQFPNVFPGTYTVVASHPSLLIPNPKQTIEVNLGNAVLPSPFLVSGYQITGKVLTQSEAVAGVDVFLYANDARGVRCEAPAADAALPAGRTDKVLCVSRTNSDGQYSFSHIPCGKYKLVPFYKRTATTYDVSPAEKSISVKHGNLVVDEAFEVKGFAVSGRVVDRSGRGVPDVVIKVNSFDRAKTDESGWYKLEQMTTGKYHIKATKPHLFFHELKNFQLSPSAVSLPEITVVRYHICGRVDSGTPVRDREVFLTGDQNVKLTATTDAVGHYCFDVVPGSYEIRPATLQSETSRGVLLSPPERHVTVTDSPVLNADFVQARVSLGGSVKCMRSPCEAGLKVTLTPVAPAGSSAAAAQRVSNKEKRTVVVDEDDHFALTDVMPGNYRLSISQDNWCWDHPFHELTVEYDNMENIQFKHVGFVLPVTTSHDTELRVRATSGDAREHVFKASAGANRFCVPTTGSYSLRPVSCYRFERESYSFDSADARPVELHAQEFLVSGHIVVVAPVPAPVAGPNGQSVAQPLQPPAFMTVDVSGTSSGTRRAARPVDADPASYHAQAESVAIDAKLLSSVPAGVDVNSHIEAARPKMGSAELKAFVYEYTFYSAPGQKFNLVPRVQYGASASQFPNVLFYPRSRPVSVPTAQCPPPIAAFLGRPGLYLTGTVTPPVSNARIVVNSKQAEGSSFSVGTDSAGAYQAGPLYDDEQYTLTAQADGYHFREEKPGHFSAQKLGEISITVLDSQKNPVQGVLLSLVGDSGKYRSNNATDANGKFSFMGLWAGQYFLRPLLKEYEFEPKSKSITVAQAAATAESFVATRTAFSAFGTVRSLNGDPENQVVVEAAVVEGPDSVRPVEETLTDSNGEFRLRGLVPNSQYRIRVKQHSATVNTRVDRASPAFRSVTMRQEDVKGMDFIAFRKLSKYDLTATINGSFGHLDSLEVELHSVQSEQSELVKTITVSKHFPFVEFFGIAEGEYLVKLRASATARTHSTSFPEQQVILDHHKHLTLELQAESAKHSAADAQGSLWGLIFALVVVYLVYNQSSTLPAALQLLAKFSAATGIKLGSLSQGSGSTSSTGDEADGRKSKKQGKTKSK